MTFQEISKYTRFGGLVLAGSCIFSGALFAQGPTFGGTFVTRPAIEAPTEAAAPIAVMPVIVTPALVTPTVASPRYGDEHKFWDAKNRVLLVTAAAFSGADFAVTRANLQSGGRELNPMVRPFGRSSAGLAVNFAGETVGVIGLSYFFHKTGHHKMERMVSVVNIGASAGAVGYGLAHR